MASSRSEENVNLKHFQHSKVSQYWSVLQFILDTFCLDCLADVIANVCFSHILIVWQMLLPFSSDLEEAMLDNGESLSINKLTFCF